jgi:hypothetical protein
MAIGPELIAMLDRVDAFRQQTASPVFDEESLKHIARSPGAVRMLISIAGDEKAPLARRYAAAEAIRETGSTAILVKDEAATRSIATMLVAAMARDQFHNRWGLPGHFVGPTGKFLLELGPGAQGALATALGDERSLAIIGSQAATLQNTNRYRIRDLAAYLVAKLDGLAWSDDPDPRVRDEGIARIEQRCRTSVAGDTYHSERD